MFSLLKVWTIFWASSRVAGDLRVINVGPMLCGQRNRANNRLKRCSLFIKRPVFSKILAINTSYPSHEVWGVSCEFKFCSIFWVVCHIVSCVLKWRLGPLLVRISNYIHCGVRGEITYLFPNVNRTTVEVWEWIWRIIVKHPRMLSAQFVALCKPEPNGYVFSSHTLPGMYILIHAGIKVNPCL